MAMTHPTIVNDDGSGTTGTVWNDAWETSHDTAIDAAIAAAPGSGSNVPVTKGGTGVATLAAHGLVIGNGTSAVAVSGAGTAGQVLTSNGASADPTFQAATGGAGSLRCSLYNDGIQVVGTAAVTALTFNAEDFDVTGLHSTSSNTSRITIPTGGAGVWWVSASIVVTEANGTGQRLLYLYKNGAAFGSPIFVPASAAYYVSTAFSRLITVADADYLEAFVYQDAGTDLDFGATGTPSNSACRFQAFKVG